MPHANSMGASLSVCIRLNVCRVWVCVCQPLLFSIAVQVACGKDCPLSRNSELMTVTATFPTKPDTVSGPLTVPMNIVSSSISVLDGRTNTMSMTSVVRTPP